ncbi:MAG: thioredoxin [Promethearchaeia archaeon]|nr:MAG: thioredoxin [Candidatus Lokiarchaeia archaeon]
MVDDMELELIRRKKIEEMMKMSQKTIPNEVINIESVDHFNKLVNDYQDSLIIVDNWAEWCGPCRAFAPTYDALQKEYHDKDVIFAKLNVDHHQDIAAQFQVTGIPTTLFIHNKKLVHRQVGMAPKPQFAQIIDAVLKKIKQ